MSCRLSCWIFAQGIDLNDAGYAALAVPCWRFALQGIKLLFKYAEMRKVKLSSLSTHTHAYFKTDAPLERTRERETEYYTPPSFSHVARIQLSHTHSFTHMYTCVYTSKYKFWSSSPLLNTVYLFELFF